MRELLKSRKLTWALAPINTCIFFAAFFAQWHILAAINGTAALLSWLTLLATRPKAARG